jgi:hypothetical protein
MQQTNNNKYTKLYLLTVSLIRNNDFIENALCARNKLQSPRSMITDSRSVAAIVRLPDNATLDRLVDPCLTRPAGRSLKSDIQTRLVHLRRRARTW